MEINLNNIIYEDNHLLVCYKDYGVLSQSDISNAPDLLTMLKEYVRVKYNKPGEAYLGLVHRLDRNTEGVMVYARTTKAASRLSDSIRNNTFHKSYIAIVEGSLKGRGKVESKLSKDEVNKKAYFDNKNGKIAILNYEALNEATINGKQVTYVKIDLVTGRFHQIRCQMASLGHPLYGDTKYGSINKTNSAVLQAYSLSFMHPTTKEILEFKRLDRTNNFKNLRS